MEDRIAVIERCIDELNSGDAAARAALVECAYAGLLVVVRKKLMHFARLTRWEQAEDVTQEAAIKLWGALQDVSPRTAAEFWALAGEQVRRVLLDLTRHHFGPRRNAAYTEVPAPEDSAYSAPMDEYLDPVNLDHWTAFHEEIAHLPEAEQNVVMAVWYCELSLEATARALGISPDTAQRRWKAARARLRGAIGCERPDS